MSINSDLKNLPLELHFLIFNSLNVPGLGVIRCVCKKFSACAHLKNLLDTHEDHTRIRFEKVVYTAMPFFPRKMRIGLKEWPFTWKRIYIARNIVGHFADFYRENGECACKEVSCFLPERWKKFFESCDITHHEMILKKHFIETIDEVFVENINEHYCLCWRPDINFVESQIQFWAVFGIVYQWTPEDFFASTRMFF